MSTTALQTFVRLATSAEPTPEDFYLALGYNSIVAPHVRQAMLSRTLSHDEVLERLTVPVLIAHGLKDEIVLPTMSEHNSRPHSARQDILLRGDRSLPIPRGPGAVQR